MNFVETKLFFIFLTQISKMFSLLSLNTLSAHSQLSHSSLIFLSALSTFSALVQLSLGSLSKPRAIQSLK